MNKELNIEVDKPCIESAKFEIQRLEEENNALRAENERLFNLFGLAMDFIHLSPCDPDIDKDQAKSWIKLQDALKDSNNE